MVVTFHFTECEHEGDLSRYTDTLHVCGAKIIDQELNYDAETADVTVEIADPADFDRQYKDTLTADYGNYEAHRSRILAAAN